MHNIFHAKCKLGFLDEAVKEIECVDVELEDWWSVNFMLVA